MMRWPALSQASERESEASDCYPHVDLIRANPDWYVPRSETVYPKRIE